MLCARLTAFTLAWAVLSARACLTAFTLAWAVLSERVLAGVNDAELPLSLHVPWTVLCTSVIFPAYTIRGLILSV